ncbi:hypothetical protein [Rhizobium leguminosarum]|uniref:hypothetical protein n=1 Tax=Rhizobium leguminosarum TaxID=384 RepID=UPI0010311333|nr:hypothetical protein [Rhizobium leguminosarum]TAX38979.1 hypothetical protein ELI05_08425 [Rhizobium leguminosarum]
MSVLNVEVLGDDLLSFFRKGAIVTVTELGNPRSKRKRYREEAVVDIGRDNPFGVSEQERADSHAFRLPGPGTYEVSVRHPFGVEVKQEAFEPNAEPQRSIVVLARSVKVRNRNLALIAGNDSVFSRNVRLLLERESRFLSVISSDHYDNSSSRIWWSRSSSPLRKPLGFEDLDVLHILQNLDVLDEDDFVERRRSIVSLDYSDLYGIYLNLQGQERESGANFPRWISISRAGYRDLVSMPWLWLPPIREDGRVAVIDLNRSGGLSSKSDPVRVDVLDSRWGSLLAYVAVGRMEEAGKVADALISDRSDAFDESLPQLALRGKLRDPLVAALGGLILVSNVEDTSRKKWDKWLQNLANWFPGIPDGAAICGYRCLQQGRYEEANDWLRKSVERGLPFFSATFRLLSLGFAQLEDDAYLRKISKGLVSVDPSQPFTVLSLPA